MIRAIVRQAVLAVEPVQPETLEDGARTALLLRGDVALPGVGEAFARADGGLIRGRGGGPGQDPQGICRRAPPEEGEQAGDLQLRLGAEPFVEEDRRVARRELTQGHVVLHAPEENLLLPAREVRRKEVPERGQGPLHQGRLSPEGFEVRGPAELQLGASHRQRVAQEQQYTQLGKLHADPLEHEVDADRLDQPPASDELGVVLVAPALAQAAGQDLLHRMAEARLVGIGGQVLAPLEDAAELRPVVAERLEDVPVGVVVIDEVGDPGRAAAGAPGEQHRIATAAAQVDVVLGGDLVLKPMCWVRHGRRCSLGRISGAVSALGTNPSAALPQTDES